MPHFPPSSQRLHSMVAATGFTPMGFGWCRDTPDHRDYLPEHPIVDELLDGLAPLPEIYEGGCNGTLNDVLSWWPGVEDQQQLGCSPVHACIAMVQYFERRATGRTVKPSRMFLYQTARQLMRYTGDTGTSLRATWKALVRFGLPPETFWPYESGKLDQEPPASLYAYADEYRGIRYVRLDPPNSTGAVVLERVKRALSAGFPCVFGFSAHDGITFEPDITYPTPFDTTCGGQAVVAVTFDDKQLCRSERGCLVVRNSWGLQWGNGGYGFLPYKFVTKGLAADFWTILKPEWIRDGQFKHHPFSAPNDNANATA